MKNLTCYWFVYQENHRSIAFDGSEGDETVRGGGLDMHEDKREGIKHGEIRKQFTSDTREVVHPALEEHGRKPQSHVTRAAPSASVLTTLCHPPPPPGPH